MAMNYFNRKSELISKGDKLNNNSVRVQAIVHQSTFDELRKLALERGISLSSITRQMIVKGLKAHGQINS